MALSRSKGFEKLFGFPPPQGKRGPGSRPIGWDRKDKVLKVLRALAYKVERARRMRQDAAESQLPAGPRSIAIHAGRQLFDRSHSRFLKAVELANRYGFTVSDNYTLYLRKGQARN
ncbi:hypothetical protein A2155_01015 [candidate division WWE3 bacterium RBG_16_52_45]|nr:MAG: hypothetical protein A2155_01015 [candidate division WWE3 bacterium RBG_16_52_45]